MEGEGGSMDQVLKGARAFPLAFGIMQGSNMAAQKAGNLMDIVDLYVDCRW